MDDVTDVTVVARRPLERWAVVGLLGVSPLRGLDLDTAFARLVHPTAAPTDVVVVVTGPTELDWVRRVRRALRGRSRGRMLAVVEGGVALDVARRAGADGSVRRTEDDLLAVTVAGAFAGLGPTTLVIADATHTPA